MPRYATVHANPQGAGDERPTALQIVKDEALEGKLAGRVIVITGTSSGIGIETARALSTTGATLYLAARNLEKAKDALKDFFDPSRMELVHMDLDSFDSIRAAAKTILSKTSGVNMLIENAGIMAVQSLQLTTDGHELQFGTNHLSHFLFFQLLKPALLSASTPEFQSRVVVVSSSAHKYKGINASDNYNYQDGNYNPLAAYAQSKTANIYMANELERRYGTQGLHATSVHPGGIMTDLGRHLPAEVVKRMLDGIGKVIKTPEQGAATTVWAAISKELEGKGGRYLCNCAVAEPNNDPQLEFGHGPHAYDPEKEARLWVDSLKIVGVADD